MFEIFSNFSRNKDWAKWMFNSLPRSFNSLHTELADFYYFNSKTIRTDSMSGVDLSGGEGVCFGCNKIGDHRVNKMFRICRL